MDAGKRKRLKEAGFKFGTVGELLGLSKADEEMIERAISPDKAAAHKRGRVRAAKTVAASVGGQRRNAGGARRAGKVTGP